MFTETLQKEIKKQDLDIFIDFMTEQKEKKYIKILSTVEDLKI